MLSDAARQRPAPKATTGSLVALLDLLRDTMGVQWLATWLHITSSIPNGTLFSLLSLKAIFQFLTSIE